MSRPNVEAQYSGEAAARQSFPASVCAWAGEEPWAGEKR
jgi:hypothetical protein